MRVTKTKDLWGRHSGFQEANIAPLVTALFSVLVFIILFTYRETVSKCRYMNRNKRAVALSNILTNKYIGSQK